MFSVLQREGEHGGYAVLASLVERCHESAARKRRLRREAAVLFRSLRRSGVVFVEPRGSAASARVRVSAELQHDFNLYQSLSLYLVEALAVLDPETPDYALELLSLVEAVIEDPAPILRAQVRKLRGELLAKLKAERVPYEERQDQPRRRCSIRSRTRPSSRPPSRSSRRGTRGWAARTSGRSRSRARWPWRASRASTATCASTSSSASRGCCCATWATSTGRSCGSVPDARKTDDVHDILAYLRTLIARVDSSLLEEWESLLHPAKAGPAAAEPLPALDLALAPRAFRARVRSELHALVRALADADYEEAARWVREEPGDPWDAARFARELAPFLAEYGGIAFDPEARKAHYAVLKPSGPRTWDVAQALLDPRGDNLWALHGEIDLRGEKAPEGPLVRLRRIGP